MFRVMGGDLLLEEYIIFNFVILGYNIWPRFNGTFYSNGLILSFIINV